MKNLKIYFKNSKILIGMIHLPPMPEFPESPGMELIIKRGLKELQTLQKSGFDAVLIENDNDKPNKIGDYKNRRKNFSIVMKEIKKHASIPVGMEILYDMIGTVEIALKTKADFVRLDVYVDNVQTRWGNVYAPAKEIKNIDKSNLLLFTDIHVKHAVMLNNKSLLQSAKEAIQYGSNAIIITGNITSEPPVLKDCQIVKSLSPQIPVIIGSGMNRENISTFLPYVDAVIVGTAIKTNGLIDIKKAKEFVQEARQIL